MIHLWSELIKIMGRHWISEPKSHLTNGYVCHQNEKRYMNSVFANVSLRISCHCVNMNTIKSTLSTIPYCLEKSCWWLLNNGYDTQKSTNLCTASNTKTYSPRIDRNRRLRRLWRVNRSNLAGSLGVKHAHIRVSSTPFDHKRKYMYNVSRINENQQQS